MSQNSSRLLQYRPHFLQQTPWAFGVREVSGRIHKTRGLHDDIIRALLTVTRSSYTPFFGKTARIHSLVAFTVSIPGPQKGFRLPGVKERTLAKEIFHDACHHRGARGGVEVLHVCVIPLMGLGGVGLPI